jgi:UV DNA damage endonuclease
MIRWGLCCQFLDADIKFRSATHRYVMGLPAGERREYLAQIAWDNAEALTQAVEECRRLGIGAFRINSQVLPLATHPVSGYTLGDLDDHVGLLADAFAHVRPLAHELGVRLSFHPDQFVVLNSERPSVLEASVRELEMQAVVSELVGADTVTLHVGGATGGPRPRSTGSSAASTASPTAPARGWPSRTTTACSPRPTCSRCARRWAWRSSTTRTTTAATPTGCRSRTRRCAPPRRGRGATPALGPFAREPYFHVSSPRDGWDAKNPRPHADHVDPADVPPVWALMDLTVDVEAKEKERAVLALMRRAARARPPGAATSDDAPATASASTRRVRRGRRRLPRSARGVGPRSVRGWPTRSPPDRPSSGVRAPPHVAHPRAHGRARHRRPRCGARRPGGAPARRVGTGAGAQRAPAELDHRRRGGQRARGRAGGAHPRAARGHAHRPQRRAAPGREGRHHDAGRARRRGAGGGAARRGGARREARARRARGGGARGRAPGRPRRSPRRAAARDGATRCSASRPSSSG